MFFRQIRRNASKSRKDNGLFFGSLVIAIVAFYTLLSLGDQDVMRFLKTMESDAVHKLMQMIPTVYVISLFFVFFLVYFAYRYQLDNRRKEFGLYLMMGMRRSRLFTMLMGETLWNSLVSVLLGVPVALLLTEGISLVTSRLVGFGIIGHKISFSVSALLWTVIGFVVVQMAAMLFLCVEFMRKEPVQLLLTDAPEKQRALSNKKAWICFILGILFLISAYGMGILLLQTLENIILVLILVFGSVGTFLLYRGMGAFLGYRIQKKSPSRSGMFTFTARQVQENVLHQYKALAIASLLLLMALSCVSFGIASASGREDSVRSVDFSVDGTEEAVFAFVDSHENKDLIGAAYPMFLDQIDTEVHTFLWGLDDALAAQPETAARNNMIENFRHTGYPYIISQTSYNNLLATIGKEPISLQKGQAALYTSFRDTREFKEILKGALAAGAYVQMDGTRYDLLPELYHDNVVADRKITLYSALIVSDEDYRAWASDSSEPFCWNILLREDGVRKNGLMQEIQSMGNHLDAAGLSYESYLGGIGRSLFQTVATSYLTIYLGVLFMLIANTVLGLKFLMQQRANKRRYLTLMMLGASRRDLSASAKKQIWMFFALVIGVAACSSVFAIWSMFTSFMMLPQGAGAGKIILLAAIAFLLFLFIEFLYITVAERTGRREIQALRVTDRR